MHLPSAIQECLFKNQEDIFKWQKLTGTKLTTFYEIICGPMPHGDGAIKINDNDDEIICNVNSY